MGFAKAVTLDIDGTVRVERYGSNDSDTTALQTIYDMIGNGCTNYEALCIRAMQVDRIAAELFIDGEGKDTAPINIFATDLMRASGSIHARDWICGKVLFVGRADDQGNSTDIGDDVERIVRSFVRPQLCHLG